MLVTVQSVVFTKLALAADPAAGAVVLKKGDSSGAGGPLPALVQRLERAADDHGRRFGASTPGPPRILARASRGTSPDRALASGGAGGAAAALAPALRMSRGAPLAGDLRSHLERHFGQDLGGVRLHTDSPAGDAARSVQARAFTLGTDIYFAPGQFKPGTGEGRALLGHEVAHAVQFQRGLTGLDVHPKADGVRLGSDRLERFAEDHESRLRGTWRASEREAVESFSIRCAEGVGPAARTAIERIGAAAIAQASAVLANYRQTAVVDELAVDAKIDLTQTEERETERLAASIVRAARRRAQSSRAQTPRAQAGVEGVIQRAKVLAPPGPDLGPQVAERRTIGGSANKVYKVRLQDGREALVKGDSFAGRVTGKLFGIDSQNQMEVAAYKLDRILGLGMVPETSLATLDGREVVQQAWSQGKTVRQLKGDPVLQSSTHRAQLADMHAFDFLIRNVDRHKGNYLVDPATGKIVLIDNGMSQAHWRPFYRTGGKPKEVTQSFLARLERLDPARLSAELGGFLDEGEVRALLERAAAIAAGVRDHSIAVLPGV